MLGAGANGWRDGVINIGGQKVHPEEVEGVGALLSRRLQRLKPIDPRAGLSAQHSLHRLLHHADQAINFRLGHNQWWREQHGIT